MDWECFEVRRVSDRIILLRLVVGSSVLTFLSVYAPQVGLSDVKDQDGTGFREVHGGYGLGVRNVEGERILEFAVVNDLVVGNTCFKKHECHLVTYQSGGISTQIDYILFRCNQRKLIVNVKTIPGEECATQNRLQVCDIKVEIPSLPKRKFVPHIKIWKLKDPVTRQKFRVAFTQRTVDAQPLG
ncbi:PREDICTED: craniofacial development protein 2-like [Priapulus caudatus]|uniref:Craniofacial development protein 2-like n=1 Tax=Priapulus caudatus TaxID=37621 RepID=A0ABM1F3Y4_PRICU|nr:PREDICTED: craniofacial development protein 2-like [Priapulus caudatus]